MRWRAWLEKRRQHSKHQVIAVIIVISLAGAAPLYRTELTTTDGWNIDLETGVEYREVVGDELNRTPWTPQNSTVYAFRKYGDLIDLETESTVSMTMVANGSVFSVDFSFVYETTRQVWETSLLKNGTDGTGEALNRSGNVTVRMYVGDSEYGNHTWVGGRVFGGFADGFWATGLGPDDNFVRVFQNQTNYLLDPNVDDKDLLSVVSADCTEGGGGGGSGGPIRFESASSAISRCRKPTSRNTSAPNWCDTGNEECRLFYYAGEVNWCDEQGTQAQWVLAIEDTYWQSVLTFDDTKVNPTRGGAHCWFPASWNADPWMTNSRYFEHANWYCHQHRDDAQDCETGEQMETHPYPYNPVGKYRDDGYCHEADIDAWENKHNFTAYQANVWDDVYHTQDHIMHFGPYPDNIQVLHRPEDCLVLGGEAYVRYGQADLPGEKSVATTNIDPAGYVSSHELGHNFDAKHHHSSCLSPTLITVMGNAEQAKSKGCYDDGFTRWFEFSEDNKDQVNNYVS